MKFSKLMNLLLIVGISALLCQTAVSQDDRFFLEHKSIGKHERPLVEFNHKLHSENKLDCVRCHHEFDAYRNNRGGEGQQCDTCHRNKPFEGRPSLKDAFHAQCKGCHEDMNAGPVMCGECHVRK